ncbi:hypothetical protein [Streptomyces sp. NPDC018059]|uniref:hypothetical protein n=1 Tax=Streptomyces sp. NPDC018059 TaxID=3365041 RepID=UPI0037ACECE7
MKDQPSTTVRIGTFRDGRPVFLQVRRLNLLDLLSTATPASGGCFGKSGLPTAAPPHTPQPPRTDPAHEEVAAPGQAAEGAVDPPPPT